MERSRWARGWVGAGLLVVLGLSGAGTVYAEEGPALPPPGSVPSHSQPVLPDDGLGVMQLPPTTLPGDCPHCPEDKKADAPKEWWQRVPVVQPFPRLGFFPIPPTGPGYYSALDAIQDNYRQGPPKYPYPRLGVFAYSFFDVDWRYLDDPKNTEHDFADCLKRQRSGPFLFTTGGELRGRYNYEDNSRLFDVEENRLRGQDNTYDLYRARVYGDLFFLNLVRVYAEFISATSPDYHLQPIIIDRNYADLLNAFVDLNLFSVGDSPLWFRVGRQELLYGSERLISPLDWANTRRTYQGGKLFWQTEKNALDLFCVQPVVPTPATFDSVDNNVVFAGAWYTHRPNKSQWIDGYYLMLDNTNPIFLGEAGRRGGSTVHTFGSRYVGDWNNFLWDFEGMMQCGSSAGQSLFAGAGTCGLGYQWKEAWGTPMFWTYYDYASGTDNPAASGTGHTFNQLFPFGHYYFGFIDVVGRRNIHDISGYLTFWPTKWIMAQLQMHNFYLDSGKDALYNAAGLPIRRDPTGASGNQVGQELDFLVNFHLSNHADLLVSYSHLFAGTFLRNTATTPSGRDNPQALYVQYSYRW